MKLTAKRTGNRTRVGRRWQGGVLARGGLSAVDGWFYWGSQRELQELQFSCPLNGLQARVSLEFGVDIG